MNEILQQKPYNERTGNGGKTISLSLSFSRKRRGNKKSSHRGLDKGNQIKWSGRLDSNQRPLRPERSAPTRLSYAPIFKTSINIPRFLFFSSRILFFFGKYPECQLKKPMHTGKGSITFVKRWQENRHHCLVFSSEKGRSWSLLPDFFRLTSRRTGVFFCCPVSCQAMVSNSRSRALLASRIFRGSAV